MSGPRSRFGLRSTSPASSIKCDRRVIVWSGDGHCTPAPAQFSKWARLTRPRRLCATRLRGASQKRIVKEPVIASGRYSSYRSTVIPENLQIFTISLIISWPLFLLPGYSPRVAVAKVAQKRRFHQRFGSFPITLNGSAITVGAMPSSEIRGKNRASCTFSGSILSSRVIATFRPNRATRASRRLNGHRIRGAGSRASERHVQMIAASAWRRGGCGPSLAAGAAADLSAVQGMLHLPSLVGCH